SKILSTNNSNSNFVDTSFTLKVPVYSKDYRVTQDEPDEVVVANRQQPFGVKNTARYGIRQIADVYRNTTIDRAYQSPSKKGTSLVVQVTETWTVASTDDETYGYSLPFSAHVIVNVPQDALITEEILYDALKRLMGHFYEGNDTTSPTTTSVRLKDMLQGALVPQSL
nr:Chain AA, coat protein [Leviviridae sp.]6YFA_AB Chain AB, coat protein [Leviviridae sp.]6YFA_AC Chain AC, coat protein [Leviviridae sp.]6YFA_AD Chain AD, coat protein [Leviviridae sp.]6YFA_AE Chain AE, coat protein [Leviviridae sp.]6YFA_AF Chain AF, coat protein [Leviviridae sp.]6YFA_AG Chain AG, coat protein [Leviviridae sp.]6YFA_AH Chain AH, coat protein [Leviviridae sp.]6YFA_AI Chain AI, coat protein [Leviviridae sp.]6YFA_AJ Chain AJ, coat protein [Leviviridae sp.]6YFA_AK Chain AK, 